jgi:hypothetical protein
MSPGAVHKVTAGPQISVAATIGPMPGPTTAMGPPPSAIWVVGKRASSATSSASGRGASVVIDHAWGCQRLMRSSSWVSRAGYPPGLAHPRPGGSARQGLSHPADSTRSDLGRLQLAEQLRGPSVQTGATDDDPDGEEPQPVRRAHDQHRPPAHGRARGDQRQDSGGSRERDGADEGDQSGQAPLGRSPGRRRERVAPGARCRPPAGTPRRARPARGWRRRRRRSR